MFEGLPVKLQGVFDHPHKFQLLADLEYTPRTKEWNRPNYPGRITVYKGTITDLASVPRAFWWLIAPNGNHRAAAIVHDDLYVKQYTTRKEADRIFLIAMKELGVSWIKRTVMWSAVRTCGWLPWRKNQEAGPAAS